MSRGPRSGYASDENWVDVHEDLISESSDSQSSSCDTSPKSHISVKERARSFENLLNSTETETDTMGFAEDLKKLKGSRAGFKGRITRILNAFEKAKTELTLDRSTYEVLHEELKGYLDKYNNVDNEVQALYDHFSVAEDQSDRKKDTDDSLEYLDNIRDRLIAYKKQVVASEQPQQPINNNESLVAAITQAQSIPGRSNASCQLFDGTNDKLDFKNWFGQFETMINSGRPLAGRYKLNSLRNHLTKGGLALKLIFNLEPNDANYQIAVDILKEEFLDEGKLIDQLFNLILQKMPTYDAEFRGLRLYVAEVKGFLSDLKTAHKVDLLTADSGGYKLVSHIIFAKIPSVIQRALIEKAKSNYPTIDQIFDNIKDVIETNLKTKPKRVEQNKMPDWRPSGSNMDGGSKGGATLENFHTRAGPNKIVFHCKFCDVDGHSSFYCNQFKTLEQRKARCDELKLCYRCTSNKHIANVCPGSKGNLAPCRSCGSKGHIGALCLNLTSVKSSPKTIAQACFTTTGVDESLLLLPIIKLKLRGHDGRSQCFNFLFDTASQRSYLSQHAFSNLGCMPQLVSDVEFDVRTFLGSRKKALKEVNLDVYTGQFKHYAVLMLVDSQFDINFKVKGLGQAVTNMKTRGFRLAAEYEGDSVTVHGLIGVDIIQYLKPAKMVSCFNGSAWELEQGIIPFGNVNIFLYPNQRYQISNNSQVSNFVDIVKQNQCPSTFVNFVMEPTHSYDDPMEHFFDESLVERRIDKMLSCDSLGIDETNESLSDYDRERVNKFRDGIELKDGEYHVELVYHDNIDQVQSNYNVALNVMDRVHKKLVSKNQYDEYLNQFKGFESEKVIERIEVKPKDFKNFIWIPHRPVFKTDEQSTTKMRPVFNASLKTKKGTPSLNEASYCGINLMKDMNDLLMLFRTNHYVYLSDIRKAFLMIKLKKIEDRNRFCFFLREGDKLICYRFTTIIFGFNASPFILNYVIQYHASLFPEDECTDILQNNFFVDNLIKSHNSEEKIMHFYKTSVERMAQGGFDLRSCNTNSEKVKQQMIKDGKFVEHDCSYEKVLGYMYSPSDDILKLAKVKLKFMAELITKRIILSLFSKIFDPLGFTSPVTIRGKILLSSLWQKKAADDHWDVVVDGESSKSWTSLARDLEGLSQLEFPRYSLSEDDQADLYFFCDASKQGYGFVAYAVQRGKVGFVVAKTKVAPIITKSLPTLELLGVFLAFKNLSSILRTFKRVKIENVYIAMDAQVVLSWLLADIVKTKNNFARNRIRDIHKMFGEITELYKVQIQYKYVPTKENPADLLTRGLNLENFKDNLRFWLYGPTWINSQNIVWPSADLKCLTQENQILVNCIQIERTVQPIVSFDRYSKINKLIGVTAKMLSALNKGKLLKDETLIFRWGTSDIWQCAKIYLLGVMQQQRFSVELDYIRDPKGKVPTLVNDLNLFIDDSGLLRSAGRTGRVLDYDYDVINPILLAKDHPLTSLIITDAHETVKHLGIATTLEKVRMAGFWINKPRQAVKNVIGPCLMCKRFNSLSFRYPKITNLPKHRVNLIRPYCHTGIDYTGEIQLREKKGEKPKSAYLLVFTCLCIRAVHIELVPDMDTKSLVLAIIRFTNLYGIPSHIYSDNAKSFIAGVDIMKEVFKASEFQEKFSKHNIKHIRIPAYSAWVGACWERMIGVIKSCLYKVVGRSAIDYFKLLTILSDVQNAVNSRPLTYRCADDSSLDIITPNHFIKPYVDNSLLFKSEDENLLKADTPCRKQVIKTLEHREYLVEKFREMWYQEYLASLRELHKDLHEVNFENKVKVNDVVLVKGPPMTKRPFWHLGRVVELIPGYDGKCRAVKVRKGDGATGTTTTHALKHLYPMELALTHDFVATEPNLKVATAQEIVGAGSVEPDVNSSLIDSVNNSSIDIETVSKPVSSEPIVNTELEMINKSTVEPVETDVSETNSDPIGSDSVVNRELLEFEEIGESVHMVEESEPVQDPIEVTSRRSRRIRKNRNSDFHYY